VLQKISLHYRSILSTSSRKTLWSTNLTCYYSDHRKKH